MKVNDYEDAFTISYAHDVVAPLTGGHVSDNHTIWQEVLVNRKSRPACIYNVQREGTEQPELSMYTMRVQTNSNDFGGFWN